MTSSKPTHRSIPIGTGPRTALSTAIATALGFLLHFSATSHAGDILRGGATAGSRSKAGTANPATGAAIELTRTTARDSLARATQATQSIQAMQAAAREAALKGANNLGMIPNRPTTPLPRVPDGLVGGGLRPVAGATANSALWQGAQLPRQAVSGGRTNVTVFQTKQQAVLNWETFNIGKKTTLIFDQGKGGQARSQWVAINKINDPSGVPSQILGNIQAPGHVYVLNQNGILFGGSSQVNTHALVASSLPINDNLVARGLLNNPDSQFLFSALEIPALASGGTMPAFTPPAAPNTPGGRIGDVVVEKGAQLTSPTTAEKVGGRIALIGPNVRNEGTISTPDGQTILAAGLQVGFTSHPTNDPSLRGLDVSIGRVVAPTPATPAPTPENPNPTAPAAPVAYAGTATNAGLIDAPRASVTIAGKNVNQLGVVQSSTSVSLNGRIDLLANFNSKTYVDVSKIARFTPGATGTVEFGPGSVTTILPEVSSTETIASSALPLASQVNVQGRAIHLGSDALVLAPGANVTVAAGNWLPSSDFTVFAATSGQIYFEAGASINVAGSQDVVAAMAQNILSLQLRGAELADSPTQRDGVLRGLSLNIDIRKSGSFGGYSWVGTPLGDASGFLNLIERNVAQLTTAGGSVKLTAGGSVVMQPGSLVDVSGGWVNFEGGLVETTRVVSGGRIYNISDATPDLAYTGIYRGMSTFTHPKWGVTETFAQPLALLGRHFEESYSQGASGGSIAITAPSVALDGELRGQTLAGPRQRDAQPQASTLALTIQAQDPTTANFLAYSPTPPRIVLAPGAASAPANPFTLDAAGEPLPLRADRRESVLLSPDLLTKAGFGSLTIDNSEGAIELPLGVSLTAPARGSVTLLGSQVEVAGKIVAPGGNITLTAYNYSPYRLAAIRAITTEQPTTPDPQPGRGIVTLASTATLSTAGLIIDERPGPNFDGETPLAIDGGNIAIAGYSADLAAGSLLDASGGVRLGAKGAATYGRGGSISIKAGQDTGIGSVIGGTLKLESTLRAFSGAQAGSLTIQAPQIQVGGGGAPAGALWLTPQFFNTGGFGSFTLAGIGVATGRPDEFLPAVVIAPGTTLEPVAQSWLTQPHGAGSEGIALVPFLKPVAGRTPVSLSFQAPGVLDTFSSSLVVRGDLVMGEGATIRTDPLGSVSLGGNTVSLLGSIYAPGGSITIAGASNSIPYYNTKGRALVTTYLGPRVVLSTAGTTLLTPNPYGHRTGTVLPGGNITVSGNLVAASGALLDVSGATGILDFDPAYVGENSAVNGLLNGAPVVDASSGVTSAPMGTRVVSQRVDSDAGSITLLGGQSLHSDATLRGFAGGPSALGGSLTISSGRFYPPVGSTVSPLDVTLEVTQSGQTVPENISAPGKIIGHVLPGFGQFTADRFTAGGFDALTLKGTVRFNGPVSISARRELSVANTGVLFADGDVQLSAPYVKLGQPFVPPVTADLAESPFGSASDPIFVAPAFGTGSLTVRAALIDIGNLSLQNIGHASFLADGGDIRGAGTLDVAGHILLRAAQIYPPTALTFTVSAADYKVGAVDQSGSVTIQGSGVRQLPYSAGGQLNIYGSIITQGGTLVAPLGGINLGWDGTGTAPKGALTGAAVATTKQITLTSGSLTSVSAIDPVDGTALMIPYGLNLNDVSWIDPAGRDITGGGVPAKTVTISGASITDQRGSLIDLRGGGELYSYRWVKGLGGSRDILAASTSFSVLPGFTADYTPYAPFNPKSINNTFGSDAGYLNSALKVGDRVHLGASEGLAEGDYTLLPARYALMPGAFLITPKAGVPMGTWALADGSSLVSGFRFNDLNSSRDPQALNARFEVAPGSVVRDRARYDDYFGNGFLFAGSQKLETTIPRLPTDAGHLILSATTSMTLAGRVAAQAPDGARAGLVDIASSSDIVITGSGGSAVSGALVLNAAQLNSFGAESLLIGGFRNAGASGTLVTVKTGDLTVDNAGTPLRGPEIILVAREKLELQAGAVIEQSGQIGGAGRADTLFIGDAATVGSGNGLLLRVSSDPSARLVRSGLNPSALPKPSTVVGAGARISGTGLTLDSTSATSLDSTAILEGTSIALNSGQISLVLDDSVTPPANSGLVLGGPLLDRLGSTQTLSLLSYSSLDVYGAGDFQVAGSLALHASQIRGFNTGGGGARIHAGGLLLDNAANATALGGATPASGSLAFDAGTIRLGVNQLRIDQFTDVALNAANALLVQGSGGLTVQNNLTATTPLLTAARAATQTIQAGGALNLLAPSSGAGGTATAGLGASLTLDGASVRAETRILLPSGLLTLHARTGDLVVDGHLDASGTAHTFYDLIRYTSAGNIILSADQGSVLIDQGGLLDVTAAAGGGNAGHVQISAPLGTFTLAGELRGQGGLSGTGGGFSLDVGSLPSFDALTPVLTAGGFSEAQSFRVRTGDVLVGSTVTAHAFNLSTDLGAVTISGLIDASGTRGGSIAIAAGGGLTLTGKLSTAAKEFDAAGKGGSVTLETRGLGGAVLDLQASSTIDLSVAAQTPESAAAGHFTGTLHLRAPQTASGTDLQMNGLAGTIIDPSSIVVEGYRIFDLTGTGGLITSTGAIQAQGGVMAAGTDVQGSVHANGAAFTGANGVTTPEYTALLTRLLAGHSDLASNLVITPGAELINRTGNLTLGTTSSTVASDWDLSTFRVGPRGAAGVLTLRAAGNLVFLNALSDGFASSAYNAPLLSYNPLLPANAQSWSYRLAAGADLSAADVQRVTPLASLGATTGSLLLGKNAGTGAASNPSFTLVSSQTAAVVGNRYQVIRTGSGDINIATGRDVQLLNQFATIYTAGTQVADPTMGGTFDLPRPIAAPSPAGDQVLGTVQQTPAYPAQYSYAGGNVTIVAQGDIAHYTRSNGQLVADSERELPMNWLYRRGFVDPATGQYGIARGGDVASTTWWVDFSNFFEGVGALGGGNVTLTADRDISNVDAVIPTNARTSKGTPSSANFLELGGGDLMVRAGRDLDAGVYYVERGHGTLDAGGSIHTNSTRSPSLTNLNNSAALASQTWLPTTLFLGKAGFDVSARGDVLLGPAANPFLLPGGYNNTIYYRTYFSTYGAESFVNASSLAGSVTLRESASVSSNTPQGVLESWLQNVLLLKTANASYYQPWLRLNETSVNPFSGVSALLPGTLRATAFSGDINLVGSFTLSPSPTGTVEFAASGSLNGLQPNGNKTASDGTKLTTWGSASINLSDANPASIPGALSPLAYQSLVGTIPGQVLPSGSDFLEGVDALFAESGATRGSSVTLTSKQALHAPGPLHAGDTEPVRLFAQKGNISGVELFSGKAARVIAGRDLSDIALYVQNVDADDVTFVSAGRDILAFNANTPLRAAAQATGSVLNDNALPFAGDIQIGGPGTLEVLAGRNLDLGIGANGGDGTAAGIVSVGNAHNPALPFNGASIIAGAGIGAASSLADSQLGFGPAAALLLTPENLTRYLPELDVPAGLTSGNLGSLSDEQRNRLTLEIFYRVLRDSGRAFNSGEPGSGNHDAAFADIAALFPIPSGGGDISLTSRAVKTQSGGSVSLFAPGGKLTVGFDVAGNQAIDQGILTEAGGDISIFTNGNVDVGTSRIFTLRGGDIIIWSSAGDIAAGAAAKTVQAAPPTRVIIDPQSANVQTDLAGLATGGGIGVLATVTGVAPGDVDLIAPKGQIDAGDAGIRVSGNFFAAAPKVLNAENIQVAGSSAGTPVAAVVSAPNITGLSSASNAAGAAAQTASDVSRPPQQTPTPQEEEPASIFEVTVLGYGGEER